MTATLTHTRQTRTAAQTPASPDTAAAERLLRDAAFALQLTRRVKEAILAGRPLAEPKTPAAPPAGAAPAVGV
jgi:hypothetical protein